MQPRFIQIVKDTLSTKKATVAILTFSIASRIIQLVYFFNLRSDVAKQTIATQNFVNGHGISIGYASPTDISSAVYEPLINWPPGYSLLLAPFYKLFNGNFVAASLCLGIIACIIFIIAFRSILKILNVPIYLVNIATLVSGFMIYYFYFISCSDAIAISLGLVAVYYSLSLLQSTDHWVKKMLGITIPLLICGVLKYLFFPIVVVIPGFLLWKGFAEKNSLLKKAAVYSILILGVTLGAMLLWQKSISGSATYISETGRGIFPEHLRSFFPFIPAAIIKPDTVSMALPTAVTNESGILKAFRFIHLFLICFFTFLFFRKLFTTGIKKTSLVASYFYLTYISSLAITLLLAFLSLQVKMEDLGSIGLWTYIEEQRYYGLPIVMIQIAVFVYYSHYHNSLSRFLRYGLISLIVLLLIEVSRGVIFDAKRILNFSKEEYSWQYEYRIQQYADSIIKAELKHQPATSVVIGGPFSYVNQRISLYKNAPLLTASINAANLTYLHTSKPTLLLVTLREEELLLYKPFLSIQGNEAVGHFGNLYFYRLYLTPQQTGKIINQ